MKIEGKLCVTKSGTLKNIFVIPKKDVACVIRRSLKYYKNGDVMITKEHREIIDRLLNG